MSEYVSVPVARVFFDGSASLAMYAPFRSVFPWMQITDRLLEHAGFLPGQQVMFSVDHRYGHITITPDYDYRIAGRYMTAPEAEAMLQRRRKRN
ncbi:hypothetical protein [Paraburkholderia xenovorans]